MSYWRYVRPDENWSRVASWTASTEQLGYEAENVANDNPALPWWSSSGTSTLTVALSSPAVSVGIIALIHNNGDDGKTITISGDISTTLTAAMSLSDYPKNLAHIPTVPVNAQDLTFAISGNSLDWAIGELVIGPLRGFTDSLLVDPTPTFKKTRHTIKDMDEDHEHEIRTDLGSEIWTATGRIYKDDAEYPDFLEWWEASKGGTIPTLIVPDDLAEEPRLVRMESSLSHERMYDDLNWVSVTFTECSRGILIQ